MKFADLSAEPERRAFGKDCPRRAAGADFRFPYSHSFARTSARAATERRPHFRTAKQTNRQGVGFQTITRRSWDTHQTEKTHNVPPKHAVRHGTTAFCLQIAADVEEIDENGSSNGVQSAFAARTQPKPPLRQRGGSFADGRTADTAPLSGQAAVKVRRVLRISAAYAPHF